MGARLLMQPALLCWHWGCEVKYEYSSEGLATRPLSSKYVNLMRQGARLLMQPALLCWHWGREVECQALSRRRVNTLEYNQMRKIVVSKKCVSTDTD